MALVDETSPQDTANLGEALAYLYTAGGTAISAICALISYQVFDTRRVRAKIHIDSMTSPPPNNKFTSHFNSCRCVEAIEFWEPLVENNNKISSPVKPRVSTLLVWSLVGPDLSQGDPSQ